MRNFRRLIAFFRREFSSKCDTRWCINETQLWRYLLIKALPSIIFEPPVLLEITFSKADPKFFLSILYWL